MRYRLSLLALALIWSACTRKPQNEDALTRFIHPDASVILQVRNLSNFKSDLVNCDYLNLVSKDAVLPYFRGDAGLLNDVDTDSTALLSLIKNADKEALLMATYTASSRIPEDTLAVVRTDTLMPEGVTLTAYKKDTLVLYTKNEGAVSLWCTDPDLLLEFSGNTDKSLSAGLTRLLETTSSRKSATLYRKTFGDPFIQFFPISKNEARKDSLKASWQSMDL